MSSPPALAEVSPEQLHHYSVEVELAARLRNANKCERQRLYREIYDELYTKVPQHPMLSRKIDAEATAARVAIEIRFLEPFLAPHLTFLEVGCGDCALSFAIASRVRKVVGVEVSEVIAASNSVPENFELVISSGTDIPVPDAAVDVAYSTQLMEHLHPDDAREQLESISRVLRPGGLYICRTPHRLQGPGDISYLFDDVATGMHLKEYTYRELDVLFRQSGFSRVVAYIGKTSRHYRVPIMPVLAFESLSRALFGRKPYRSRQEWLRRKPFTMFLQGVNIVGQKT